MTNMTDPIDIAVERITSLGDKNKIRKIDLPNTDISDKEFEVIVDRAGKKFANRNSWDERDSLLAQYIGAVEDEEIPDQENDEGISVRRSETIANVDITKQILGIRPRSG